MSAQTPPDTCPVCGTVKFDISSDERSSDGRRYFQCGLTWKVELNQYGDHYYGACASATLAALRCGATLHPTAREQVRDALVAAAKEWAEASAYASMTEGIERKLWHAIYALVTLEPRP